jgi:hypothetical protein
MNTQQTWRLLAPDLAALDTVWQNELPFVLWPIGHQPLLAHWMDEAVRRGVELVELYVADRPAEIRAWLDEGAYWSRRVRLIPIRSEDQAPADAARIDHLPGLAASCLPESAAALPGYWFELQKQWLALRSPDAVTVDRLHPSGGWVGPQARIHPHAKLTAPFWIGARVRVGPECEIGPHAFIGEGAVLDRHVQVEEACVLPGTYLGQNTRLFHAAAAGSDLVDFRRGCRVEIAEPFVMSPVTARSPRPGLLSRALALLCWLILAPFAHCFSRKNPAVRTIRGLHGEAFDLHTRCTGPLFLRRAGWLKHIAAGRLRWIGILPRRAFELAQVPLEIVKALQTAPPGMFSLADVHGCHEPTDLEEWIHAALQASAEGGNSGSLVLRNLWKIAWSQPTNSSLV